MTFLLHLILICLAQRISANDKLPRIELCSPMQFCSKYLDTLKCKLQREWNCQVNVFHEGVCLTCSEGYIIFLQILFSWLAWSATEKLFLFFPLLYILCNAHYLSTVHVFINTAAYTLGLLFNSSLCLNSRTVFKFFHCNS